MSPRSGQVLVGANNSAGDASQGGCSALDPTVGHVGEGRKRKGHPARSAQGETSPTSKHAKRAGALYCSEGRRRRRVDVGLVVRGGSCEVRARSRVGDHSLTCCWTLHIGSRYETSQKR